MTTGFVCEVMRYHLLLLFPPLLSYNFLSYHKKLSWKQLVKKKKMKVCCY